jgi:hypothetical protein
MQWNIRTWLCIGTLMLGTLAHGQLILAGWNFPNNPDNATVDVAVASNNTRTIYTSGTGVLAFNTAGATSFSASCTGWNSTAGTRWWEIELSTTGYAYIEVSSKQRSSAQGPRDFALQYRIGAAGVWTNIPGAPSITVANNWTSGVLNNVLLPAACENVPSLFLRWITTSDLNISGNVMGTGGVSNIDDLFVAANSDGHFRTISGGAWSNSAIWERSPTGADPWSPTNYSPSRFAETITIRNGHAVDFSTNGSFDQLTIDQGGTLTVSSGVQTIHDGPGVDLQVNGTFIEANPTAPAWVGTPTWALGGNGTYVKTLNTAANIWRDRYNGGISNIAETARWILRKTTGTGPALTSVGGMVYPNLIIENALAGNWDAATTTQSLISGTSDRPVILGNLDIGGIGTGTVTYYNNNSNSNPVPVLGDIIVRSGSTLSLG